MNLKDLEVIKTGKLKKLLLEENAIVIQTNIKYKLPKLPSPPICDTCGLNMVIQIANSEGYTGNLFWGCRNYPDCPPGGFDLISKEKIFG